MTQEYLTQMGRTVDVLFYLVVIIASIAVLLLLFKLGDTTVDFMESTGIQSIKSLIRGIKKKRLKKEIDKYHAALNELAKTNQYITPEMEAIAAKTKVLVKELKPIYEQEDPTLAELEKTPMERAVPITDDDVTLSTLIFNKIDEMILTEAQYILLPLASLGKNIDVRNFGDHVESVATEVQKGLNFGIYKSQTMFKPEYINSYIIKRAKVVVLTLMNDLNKQLPPPE